MFDTVTQLSRECFLSREKCRRVVELEVSSSSKAMTTHWRPFNSQRHNYSQGLVRKPRSGLLLFTLFRKHMRTYESFSHWHHADVVLHLNLKERSCEDRSPQEVSAMLRDHHSQDLFEEPVT